jgi:glycine/D-amino acid oxidase-like deaminating enzyme
MTEASPSSDRIAAERAVLSASLWQATAGPAPDCPPLQGEASTEVAVVGAGFTGLSTALHLAERGVAVTVLDAQAPGWGASGRNGGQVIAGLKEDPEALERLYGPETAARLTAFSGSAPDVLFDLAARHGIACSARRSGWIQPAHTDAARRLLEERVRQWSARGAPIRMLDAAETARLIGTERYLCAALDLRGGSVQPLDLAQGMAAAAQRLGARVHGQSPVTRLERAGDGWLLHTPAGRLKARQVVLGTNGYADALHDGLRRSVVPVVSVQVATAPLSDNLRRSILPEGQVASDMRRLMFYYRLSPCGRLVMGGRGAYGDGGIAAQMAGLRQVSSWFFPQIGVQEWTHQWGGFVAMTPDHLPHLHELAPGLVAAAGYNGRGVAMATAMGRVLADRATGTPAEALGFPPSTLKPIPLHAFRRLGVAAVVGWRRWLDRRDAAAAKG